MNLFPNLTETFIYREVDSVRACGVDILTYSMRAPRVDEVSAEARKYFADTHYILPVPVRLFVTSHLAAFLQDPRRYLRVAFDAVTGTHDHWADRLRTLAHFAEAVTVMPVIRASGVQHLHAHFAVGSATVTWVLARLLDLPFSVTAHAYDIWQDRLLLPEKLSAAKFVVTCTEHNRQHLLATYPGTRATIVVVHHGVDARRFAPVDRRDRAVPHILAVGRLCEQKGFEILLRACALLAQQGEAFECRIIGDGPLRNALHALARELGMTTRVHFLGRAFQEEMPQYYAEADLFVLPCTQASDNDRDGIPNTLMEAMASGLPVVSTWFSGIPELVHHGTTGLLVERDDPAALAAAMRRLLREPALRQRFGAAGRERVMAHFSLERAAARLAELFGDARATLHRDSEDHITEALSA
jgi:glycosyltransferase involved in cell wall biosynthesis